MTFQQGVHPKYRSLLMATLLALSFLGKMTAQPTNGFTFMDGKPTFYQSDKFNKFQTLNTLTIPKGKNLDSVYYARDTNSVFQWDQIPAEDLAMSSYALDTSAEAVVLFDVGFIEAKTSFPEGFSSTLTLKVPRTSAVTSAVNEC